VSLLGVTGERQSLATTAIGMAQRLKAVTDRPVIIGIGISTPEQAREACTVADGVVMASALMRLRLAGASVGEVAAAARKVREAMDG
jgi:tryptophan synthase alpha chain